MQVDNPNGLACGVKNKKGSNGPLTRIHDLQRLGGKHIRVYGERAWVHNVLCQCGCKVMVQRATQVTIRDQPRQFPILPHNAYAA